MISKKIYSKVDIDENSLVNKNTKVSLEYYLLRNIYNNEEMSEDIETYGIELIKKEYVHNNIVSIEKESAKHLSLDKVKVEKILESLSENYVTPLSFYNVLDDLVGIYF